MGTPRIVGTPQSSAGNGPTRLVSVGSALTPTGPEKPQRTYEEKARSISQGNPPRGVRFQDPKEETKVNDVNSYLEQLRLSSVEREFRKRIAGNKQNEESGSEGDGEIVRSLVN